MFQLYVYQKSSLIKEIVLQNIDEVINLTKVTISEAMYMFGGRREDYSFSVIRL